MSEYKDVMEATELDWSSFNISNPSNPDRKDWTFQVDVKTARFTVVVKAKDYDYAYEEADGKVADLLTSLGVDNPDELDYYYEIHQILEEESLED